MYLRQLIANVKLIAGYKIPVDNLGLSLKHTHLCKSNDFFRGLIAERPRDDHLYDFFKPDWVGGSLKDFPVDAQTPTSTDQDQSGHAVRFLQRSSHSDGAAHRVTGQHRALDP